MMVRPMARKLLSRVTHDAANHGARFNKHLYVRTERPITSANLGRFRTNHVTACSENSRWFPNESYHTGIISSSLELTSESRSADPPVTLRGGWASVWEQTTPEAALLSVLCFLSLSSFFRLFSS